MAAGAGSLTQQEQSVVMLSIYELRSIERGLKDQSEPSGEKRRRLVKIDLLKTLIRTVTGTSSIFPGLQLLTVAAARMLLLREHEVRRNS
jgi:hypothetical protein